MSEQIAQSALTALRSTTDGAPRLATSGLSSPGDVAGRFASMLAGLRDGTGAIAAPAAVGQATTASPASAGGGSDPSGELRVGFSAVSLLMEGMPETGTAADPTDDTPRSRRPRTTDVSGQVVDTAIAAGTHSDGRWMATLLAVGAAE